jgi:acyl transferase domain-containing protein/NAD(P)H-dependent flavin oxidoreductase YrpB (nitropropane dioxygenase family)/NAD(P)-dependent dehydrogenase (short-subunit alcohol dehydrogenase family)/phosphopantetheinyl transferase (holo-ACP synthase)/acyl carrier protein
MTGKLPFGLTAPIIYVNPPVNRDLGLVEAVSRSGGLGVVDLVSVGAARPDVPSDVVHGLRIRLDDALKLEPTPRTVLAIIPLEDVDALQGLEPGTLQGCAVPVVVEVANLAHAAAAERAGAAGLIARGNEGPGWVSATNGLVLLQEVLACSGLPVFLQGGVGPHTAAGAVAAGAAGVVLDVHLLLAEESGLETSLKKFLGSLDLPATVTLADASGTPCRVYSRIGTRAVRELRKLEDTRTATDWPSYRQRIASLTSILGEGSPDTGDFLLPLSEDIVTARHLAERHQTAQAIVQALADSMKRGLDRWPFVEGAPVTVAHGTRFPIVQGPMAHVSDNADFLAAMKSAGALPFLAMGNMPEGIARDAIQQAREKTGGTFGVGLIGLEVNRTCYEAHLKIMKENPPRFAILAAGSIELAQQIESLGTACYLHCPSPLILSEALKAGLRHFVFEGCESGGHIGALGSLDLWGANLHALEAAERNGLDLSQVTVLFAGGIGSGRAAAFVAGMVNDLVARGLNVGLQMGTAYLATEEAVSTAAVTRTYQRLAVESRGTVVIGKTVNTRARAASSPMAQTLIGREYERIRDGVPLRERKELYEKDNLGALRLAAKGCAIDPTTATCAEPVFCDLPEEGQLQGGLYLMGQVVSLLDSPTTADELHSEIIENGRRIFERSLKPVEREVTSLEGPRPEAVEIQTEIAVEPIAVVGIGLRFPGADSPEAFWDAIVHGRSGVREVPEGRWDHPDFYYDPDPKAPDKTYSRIGGFVTDFVFDPLKYRIPPAVARKMDRTQQFAVACVADALADAGISPADLRGKRVGIIIGNSMGGETTDRYAARVGLPRALARLDEALRAADLSPSARNSLLGDFRSRYLEDLPEITEDSLPGELANVISGRVANVFNLEGPNFTVDAACASSIAAVMNSVSALRQETIDWAVTGGVDAAMHPSSFVKFCKIGALSPDGSRPFDESANGFVMGEGAGILVLKCLSDALRDGDRIYGTIVAIGSSSDGRGKGITAPNAAGQERAIKACLDSARISLDSISLIEAHGTSTAVGDKTELMVLDKAFREVGLSPSSVGIGSVKSQIGHLKAAAGAAGLIKALLAVHHRTLPPTINVTKANSCVEWSDSPIFLVTEPQPWKQRGSVPRRAGVSAFGFGGTNFHAVVQEHVQGLRVVTGSPLARASVGQAFQPAIGGLKSPPHKGEGFQSQVVGTVKFTPPDWPRPPQMDLSADAWVVGAANLEELSTEIDRLIKGLETGASGALAASSRQDASGREVRCAFAGRDSSDAVKKLSLLRGVLVEPQKRPILAAKGIHLYQGRGERARRGVAFLFPGQGSQYPFMLRDLAERFSVVAQTIAEADGILVSLGRPSVTSLMFSAEGGGEANGVNRGDAMKDTQTLQPMILTVNIAMCRLLEQFGVVPVACAGHSLGEYAACVAAGVFSFRDGLEAVAVRGTEMAKVSIADPGLMMSIPADARLVEEVLGRVEGYVVAANKNSPKQTVISGETAAVKEAAELFQARGIEGTLLPVSAAFHSGVVAPAREPFMKTLSKLRVNAPSVPIISNVTGDFYPSGPAAADRIRELLGRQFAAPVEWVKTLRRLYNDGVRVFLECGPKRVLTNLTSDTLPEDTVALPSNHPKKGGMLQLMETLAALAAEGAEIDWSAADEAPGIPVAHERPQLHVVRPDSRQVPEPVHLPAPVPGPLEGLLDSELRQIAGHKDFPRFVVLQGEPIRNLIKSSFQSFVEHIVPMENTLRVVRSEGMDFQRVVVSGISAGLPSDVRFPFDGENLDDLVNGRNFIKRVPAEGQRTMLEKNIERLVKGPDGGAELQVVEDVSGVIKLAGFFSEWDLSSEYGLDEHLAASMDVTARLALAAGIEALREAGIPLILRTRTTSTGHELPDSWALPEQLREETGVIFASAFPGLASLVDEVTSETASRYDSGAKKRLIEFYTGLLARIGDDQERDRVTKWFTEEFNRLNPEGSEELYTFNRNFLFRVLSMGSGQLAQYIKARGPNTQVNAACASTTQAILVARDWIRTGQAKRVLVVAADDVAGKTLFPWLGSGFLAMGAATTSGNLSEAALPFDDRRNGLLLGSAAVGVVMEREDLVRERGVEPIVSVEAGTVANSAFHGTRLDVAHIGSVMERMIEKWEEQSGLSRTDLARDLFFMSHETYSPKRGGSAAAEIEALRRTFGDNARRIPIANTKGFTGHTMGVGVEDVVAMRCLQKGTLPPVANLKQPDPDFADLSLSRGGPCHARYALRLAAGFGSQIVVSLYKKISGEENRLADLAKHRAWLQQVTGYSDPVVSVDERILRVRERRTAEAAQGTESVGRQVAGVLAGSHGATPAQPEGEGRIREKVLALLAEKTGYPAEMLDTQLDLEADLGIDTVKQAEFISEVREAFCIPRIEGLKIADFPTIEHIIEFVVQHSGRLRSTELESQPQTAPVDRDQDIVRGDQEIEQKILALLADKTGYPPDMLDLDLDLEADLGIDTVKQAEFIADVRELFHIPRIEGLKIADFPTIRHIVHFVTERMNQESAQPEVAPEERSENHKMPKAEEEVRAFETRLVKLPDPGPIGRVEVDRVLIFGGADELAERVEQEFSARGYGQASRIGEPVLPDNVEGARVGIVNLFATAAASNPVRDTFSLYVACARAFEHGPSFLVTAVSEDGAFGFQEPAREGYLAGAVVGATKAFGRELPDTRVRVLDLHPHLTASEWAGMLLRSVEEAFPVETGVSKNLGLSVVRLVPFMDEAEESRIEADDVVLVSGGARGITAACVQRLAEQAKLTFVILGRTPLSSRADNLAGFSPQEWEAEKTKIIDRMKRTGTPPTPVKVERELSRLRAEAEVAQTLRALRAAGSEVIYRVVDVREANAVDRVIDELGTLCRRVDLVVHGAGIDDSRALRSKSVEFMEAVYSVKVDGLRNLLESLERHGLPARRVVGFGSVSGRFGNVGQIDYAAANDGLAHLVRWADREMDATLSIIDWAPWSEVGMATRGSVQQTLEAAGVDFISPETGARLFSQELSRTSGPSEVVIAGRLGPFNDDASTTLSGEAVRESTLAGQRCRVSAFVPGEYVRATVTLDPSHPLLDHHRIDRAAVLPGVGGLEIMRGAAAFLNPEARKADFEGVRFRSPLKIFRDEPFQAEVEVVRLEEESAGVTAFRARLFSWFTDKEGRKIGLPRVHHECRLTLAASEDAPLPDVHRWTSSIWIAAHDLYALFFHGPGFRFLDLVTLEANGDRVRFLYRDTAERAVMFGDSIPGAVEAAFQAAAALGVEARGIMTLPIGVGSARVHRPDGVPASGELVFREERLQDGVEGRRVLVFDGTVTDGDGIVLLTLKGVEMVELDRSAGFSGRVFEEIVEVDEVVKTVQAAPETYVAATLTDEEALEYLSKKVPKRAAEWLAGRVALKQSIRRLALASGREDLQLNEIRVLQNSEGKPIAELLDRQGQEVGLVSLSHSNGLAVAVASAKDGMVGLGVDIEKIEPRSESWVNDYFTSDEIRHAGQDHRRWAELSKMWCVKEAALKALGTGLTFDLKEIEASAMDAAGYCSVAFLNDAARYVEKSLPGRLEARVQEWGGTAIATAVARPRESGYDD